MRSFALPGFRKDVPRVLRAMDVMVHASSSPEPFGRVLIEGDGCRGARDWDRRRGGARDNRGRRDGGCWSRRGMPPRWPERLPAPWATPEQRSGGFALRRQVVEQRFTMQAYVSA
jgi:hypothetical protein